MTTGLILGIDAGGSYVKADLVDLETRSHVTRSAPVPVRRPRPGHVERDPEELWRLTLEVVGTVLEAASDAGAVRAIGLTGHGNGLYLVDPAGRPTRAAILAADTRAADMVRRWTEDGAAERLLPSTWNGLWPGQPGPLLAWLKIHEPRLLTPGTAILSCKDYLRTRFTGTVVTELTDLSCSGLFDNDAGTVSTLVAAELGLPDLDRLLPGPVSPTWVAGLAPEVAAMLGLPAGTPVVAGVVDNVALQIGSGVLDDTRVCISSGTWSVNQVLLPASRLTMADALGRVRPLAACRALPSGMAMLGEASATSASVLEWALSTGLTGPALRGGDPYASVLAHCAGRLPTANRPYFLPFLGGSRDEPRARAAWVGVDATTTEDDLTSAVVEGICFEHRRHVERLERALPGAVPVRLSGGATRSAAWIQVFADVLDRPVDVLDTPEIGTAGAAMVAAVGAAVLPDLTAAVSALGGAVTTIRPRADVAARYAERYVRYQRVAATVETLTGE